MAEVRNFETSTVEHFIGDYFRTFARLLDPNLPPRQPVADDGVGEKPWPIGQAVAFGTLAVLGLAASLAAVIGLLA